MAWLFHAEIKTPAASPRHGKHPLVAQSEALARMRDSGSRPKQSAYGQLSQGTARDGLHGVQNRHVLSLLPDVGHVPRLVGHSAPGHGGRANSASFRR